MDSHGSARLLGSREQRWMLRKNPCFDHWENDGREVRRWGCCLWRSWGIDSKVGDVVDESIVVVGVRNEGRLFRRGRLSVRGRGRWDWCCWC